MRKLLSVILAICMVLSTVAFAVPSAVYAPDSADENLTESEDATSELATAKKIARGVNMLTGTKDAFDGENYTDLSWIEGGAANVSIVDDPLEKKGKVVQFEFPANGSSDWQISTFKFGADIDDAIGHTYMYISFDYRRYVPETDGYIPTKQFYIQNSNSGAGDFAPVSVNAEANEGWAHYGKVHDISINYNGDPITSSQYYNNFNLNTHFIFNHNINKNNTVPVYIHMDNLVFAPAYKVTYYNKAGTKAIDTDYVVVDSDGKLLSSFTPKTAVISGDTVYSAWSTSASSENVLSSVPLTENADIALYATKEDGASDKATMTLSSILTKVGQTATASVTIDGNPEIDKEKVTWSSDNTSVATVSYDDYYGKATVTAVANGTANLTFKYGDFSFTKKITVATEPLVATNITSGQAIAEFEGADLDVYKYVTVNYSNRSGGDQTVTLYNTSKGVSVDSASVAASGGNKGVDVEVEGARNLEFWKGYASGIALNYDAVTINNVKLWAELRTEPAIELSASKDLIYEKGSSITVKGDFVCDLEGIYDDTFYFEVVADSSVATYKDNGDGTVTITGVGGSGVVTVKAISNHNSSITATKQIFVSIKDSTKPENKIAYKWDFENSSNPGWSANNHHAQTTFSNGAANVVSTSAKLYGTDSAVKVAVSKSGSTYTLASATSGAFTEYGKNSTDFVLSDYPYFCVKAKAENPGTYPMQLYITVDGLGHSESRKANVSMNLTSEYQTFVFDVSSIANQEDVKGKNYGGIMLTNNVASVIDTTGISSSNTLSSLNYTSYNPIIFDEIYFANYDSSAKEDPVYGVTLKTDKTTVSGNETATLTPTVFSNVTVENSNVDYTVSADGYVSIFKNSDGTATVTPLKDGTVTITATSVLDSTAKASVTLTLSNIPKRTVAYDLKLMLIGNSYLEHAYKQGFDMWLKADEAPRGMAASAADKDYYSLLCKYLTQTFSGNFTSKKQGGAPIEQAWKKGLKDQSSLSNLTGWDKSVSLKYMRSAWKEIIDYMDKEQPNLITIQLAENAAHATVESATFFYDELFKVIDEHRPENSVVVVLSPFNSGDVAVSVQPTIAKKYGFYWSDNTAASASNYANNYANPYLAFAQYPDYDEYRAEYIATGNTDPGDFRSHPGDKGMELIAKNAFEIFKTYIPTTIPADLVTIPESITISGDETISTKGGSVSLSVNALPSGASSDVTWSVDNEYLASVDKNGKVTALLNGVVTVTATSVYDSSVKATKTIAISGQTQHYTLTYDAGTTDTVTGIPSSFLYASGDYKFPELVVAPQRTGYKFVGWSETKGGNAQKTVNMSGKKTVYAVWDFADSWHFDTDAPSSEYVAVYLEGCAMSGYNTMVKDGVATTISFGGTKVAVSNSSLALPSEMYKKLKFKIAMSTAVTGDKLNITVNSTGGTKTYSVDVKSTELTEYTVDISNVTGTITGFGIVTSNADDGVGMTVDYVEFVKGKTTGDVSFAKYEICSDSTLDANGKLMTVTDLNVAKGATLTLGAGTYYIANITGDGKIVASQNANVIITGTNKPDGYVQINIGKRANGAKRYAEVGGNQYAISEDDDNEYYGVIVGDKSMLIQIVEETSSASSTKYIYVNAADKTYTNITLGNYMYNSSEKNTIRLPDEDTNNTPGLRFAATVTTQSKYNATDCTISEYGYIIGLEDTLINNGEQLNFDSKKYVSAPAYKKGTLDVVFEQPTDALHVFTGVLYGTPEDKYDMRIVAKTYTKLTVNSEEYIVYGEPMVQSYYSIAKSILDSGTSLTTEQRAVMENIIKKATDFGNEGPGLDYGDLW